MERVRIWTDGCCLGNPGGAGGWAIVVEAGGHVLHEDSGGTAETTNNRMELAALIEALRFSQSSLGRSQVEVVSDSKYAVEGATNWMHSWKRKEWKRKVKGKGLRPIKNADLWLQIDRLMSATGRVKVTWIKGHAGHEFNERADRLADVAAKSSRRKRRAPQNAGSRPAEATGAA